MLPTYFDYIFVYLRQKIPLKSELSPDLLSTLCPNSTRKARPDLQLWAGLMLKMMNVHDAQPHQKPLTIAEKLKKIVQEDRRLSIRLIAGRMSIDKETV